MNMQEVFGKIIYNKILVIKVSDVKEIIEQLATECENGWILCKERLPKDGLPEK